MATMAIPMGSTSDFQFQDVEDTVDFVRAGARFTNRAGTLVRLIYKAAVLSYALSKAIEKQGALIEMLNGPKIQSLSAVALADVAAKIEHLVSLNDDLLYTAYPGKFEPWNEMLSRIKDQRETLHSVAESFRAACDPEHQELLVAALETIYA